MPRTKEPLSGHPRLFNRLGRPNKAGIIRRIVTLDGKLSNQQVAFLANTELEADYLPAERRGVRVTPDDVRQTVRAMDGRRKSRDTPTEAPAVSPAPSPNGSVPEAAPEVDPVTMMRDSWELKVLMEDFLVKHGRYLLEVVVKAFLP